VWRLLQPPIVFHVGETARGVFSAAGAGGLFFFFPSVVVDAVNVGVHVFLWPRCLGVSVAADGACAERGGVL